MQHISRREVKFAHANGIDIAYQTFGDKDASPLILIMGLGSQMVLWDGEFCRKLAAGGYRVIRFDNRDIGLSTKLDWMQVPDTTAVTAALQRGEVPALPTRSKTWPQIPRNCSRLWAMTRLTSWASRWAA
jgi:pimeloyl-ACP methyl ester carboxylesterase